MRGSSKYKPPVAHPLIHHLPTRRFNILPSAAAQGKILSVEGPKDNKVATIEFKNDDMPERRLVLKFAKLQVV